MASAASDHETRSFLSCSEFRDERLGGEPGLLDDVTQGALWQGLVAMHRNADRPNRGAIVTKNVVTASNTVDPEPQPQQSAHCLLSGNRRQAFRSHSQAAMVR